MLIAFQVIVKYCTRNDAFTTNGIELESLFIRWGQLSLVDCNISLQLVIEVLLFGFPSANDGVCLRQVYSFVNLSYKFHLRCYSINSSYFRLRSPNWRIFRNLTFDSLICFVFCFEKLPYLHATQCQASFC